MATGMARATGRNTKARAGKPSVKIIASGFNNPRGLTFGPGGALRRGGRPRRSHSSTVGQCEQAHGRSGPVSREHERPGARRPHLEDRPQAGTCRPWSTRSRRARPAPPSAAWSAASRASQFLGHKLYGLLAGAGCSHGVPDVPNGVFKVGKNGELEADREPERLPGGQPGRRAGRRGLRAGRDLVQHDAVSGNALYPMDSNHGELDKVTPSGKISRVIDISAQVGHVVPTAIIDSARQGHGHGHALEAPQPSLRTSTSATSASSGLRTARCRTRASGSSATTGSSRCAATGLEQVLGLAFRGGKLYALEMSTTPGGPTPGTGAIVQVGPNGPKKTIVSGLIFPTGMTVGPRRRVLRLRAGLRLRCRRGPGPEDHGDN